MELQVGVKVLLKNAEGKYLLIRRNPMKYPEVGPKWDIVGGRIIPGIPLLENLVREVKEETSLDLTENPILISAQDILRIENRHVVRLTYTASILGEPKVDEESLEYKWFSKEEISTLPEAELDIYFKDLLDRQLLLL